MEKRVTIGELSQCPVCSRQPSLFVETGKGYHHTECAGCRVRLWAMPTAQEAIEHWERVANRQEDL